MVKEETIEIADRAANSLVSLSSEDLKQQHVLDSPQFLPSIFLSLWFYIFKFFTKALSCFYQKRIRWPYFQEETDYFLAWSAMPVTQKHRKITHKWAFHSLSAFPVWGPKLERLGLPVLEHHCRLGNKVDVMFPVCIKRSYGGYLLYIFY